MSSPEELWQELQNPSIDPLRLSQIAAEVPQYGAAVAAHPQAYPALLDWLAQYGDPAAQAAVAARRTAPAAPAPVVPAPVAPAPAAPMAPAPAAYPAAAPSAAAPARRRVLGMTVPVFAAAVAGAVLIAGGGVSAAVLVPMLSAPQSPTAVAQRIIGSVGGLDPLGVVGVVAPSEATLLVQPLSSLQQLQTSSVDPAAVRSFADAIGRLRSAVQVSTSGLRFEEEAIVPGQVARVTLVEGTIRIDGDEQRLADALFDIAAAQLRPQLEAWGYSEAEIEDSMRQGREEMAASIDLPQELHAADLLEQTDGRLGLEIVTVREGNGWYLSPMLTFADYAYLGNPYLPDEVMLGDEIPAPVGAATPGEAWQRAFAAAGDTTAGRDWMTNLAATLTLPERRLIAVYGPAFVPEGNPYVGVGSDTDLEITADFGDVRVEGPRAYLGDWDIEMRLRQYGDESGTRIQGLCFDTWSDYGSSGGCLDDLIDEAARSGGSDLRAADFGLDDLRFVAVNEGSGWQASVVGTVGDALARVSNAIVELSKQGRLGDLCGTGFSYACF